MWHLQCWNYLLTKMRVGINPTFSEESLSQSRDNQCRFACFPYYTCLFPFCFSKIIEIAHIWDQKIIIPFWLVLLHYLFFSFLCYLQQWNSGSTFFSFSLCINLEQGQSLLPITTSLSPCGAKLTWRRMVKLLLFLKKKKH